jgi:D-amino-acid dehydrogenase
MRVAVLGAGVVGVASAWYLAADGHEVTVLDRQPLPAQETSFANGGQISVSHAEPWANPGAPLRVLKWLGREDSPLLWRFRADMAQWRWGLDFLSQCTTARTRRNIQAIIQLGLYSRAQLQQLRKGLSLEYEALERGILHFYTDEAEYASALRQAAVMREFGCDRQGKTATECLMIEPALGKSLMPVLGGTFTASDESGDARQFTEALAARAQAGAVNFRFNAEVSALEVAGGTVKAARLVTGERVEADAFVLALGSYSPLLLQPHGIRLPVYPAKGYSATIPLDATRTAPVVSLTDDGHKLVFSRLGDRLRVAGTAEFSGYDRSLNVSRCESLMRRVEQVFPDLAGGGGVEYWAGLRPATPGNVPLIGKSGLDRLWLNTGHGTLGWTLSCGSGRLLADIVGGRTPEIDPAFYRLA